MSDAAAAASAITQSGPIVIGRYALFDELASGGMATVHLGRLLGPVGFGRTVAVKRLHEHYLKDEEFIAMFMDEARIVARIRHPNVVPMVDVVQSDKGLFLIMEYVHGETLSRLMRTSRQQKEQIPPKIVAAILYGVLMGLHGAHETKGADGKLLGVVHRDVSPQNVIIGADGTPRVLDFGIAKAAGRAQVTREGQIKGKLAYMAPEQIRGQVDRRTDVFAAAVVLWEALAGRRLHEGSKDVDIVTRVIKGNFPKPSEFAPGIPPELDAIVAKGLDVSPEKRYASARDLALDLEKRVGLAPPSSVVEWVERLAPDVLRARAALVDAMEIAAADLIADDEGPPPSLSFSSPQSSRKPSLGGMDTIPVEMEVVPPSTSDPNTGTSSVFAHTPSPHVLADGPRPAQNLKALIAVVVASGFLALIGLTLGVYALVHRDSAAPSPPPSLTGAPSAMPSLAPPPSASISPPASASGGTPEPSSTTSAASPATPSSASASPSSNAQEGTAAAGGSVSTPIATPIATGAGTIKSTPGATPSVFVPTPKPQPKKPVGTCDPPYTLDEVGHRKYKPECLGLD